MAGSVGHDADADAGAKSLDRSGRDPGGSPDVPVVADGLSKYYGDVVGAEDVSFRLASGEIFGFLGPNGAGKTTTIRLLLGLLRPSAGGARLFGQAVDDEAALLRAKRRIGYIPGEFTLYERLTGETYLDYVEAVRGGERRAELSRTFDAPLEREVGEYSRGNKQKLAFIQAFMHDPDLVIMDEPTAGLDPLMQQTVYRFLERERAAGTTVFFSSHILTEVQEVCDRVGIIRGGRLIAVEDVGTLLERSGKVVEITSRTPLDPDDFRFEGSRVVEADDSSLELVLTDGIDRLVHRLDPYPLADLTIRPMTLDDVFLHYYEEEVAEVEGEDWASAAGEDGDDGGPGRRGGSRSPLEALRSLLGRGGRSKRGEGGDRADGDIGPDIVDHVDHVDREGSDDPDTSGGDR